jgi:excisionase family DNA binding protein
VINDPALRGGPGAEEEAPAAGGGGDVILLTVREASERTGVSPSLIYDWCSQGLLPHYRFGKPGCRGKVLINEAELEGFIAAHRREARPQAEAPPLKHIRLNHG